VAIASPILPAGLRPVRLRKRWQRYALEARRPLHCLLLLAPLAVAYECGLSWLTDARTPGRNLLAHGLIEGLLAWVGLVGRWVPPAVLIVSLLVWHRLRHDGWRVRWWVPLVMPAEGLALAIPLLALSALFAAPPLAHPVAALGAGIYEELVFRLLLISGLNWLLVEVLQRARSTALGLAVVLAALTFALCHFLPLGSGAFAWKSFGFRLVAGLYLSMVFLERGLGVSSSCHVAYNLLLLWLRGSSPD